MTTHRPRVSRGHACDCKPTRALGDMEGGDKRVSGGAAVTLHLSDSQSMQAQGRRLSPRLPEFHVAAHACRALCWQGVTVLAASLFPAASPLLGFPFLFLQPPANSGLQAEQWGGLPRRGGPSKGSGSWTAPYFMAGNSLLFHVLSLAGKSNCKALRGRPGSQQGLGFCPSRVTPAPCRLREPPLALQPWSK